MKKRTVTATVEKPKKFVIKIVIYAIVKSKVKIFLSNFKNTTKDVYQEMTNLGFYEKNPVLKEKASVREQRLSLIAGVAVTLRMGLELLGIKVSERI